jgi:hypothetical protein
MAKKSDLDPDQLAYKHILLVTEGQDREYNRIIPNISMLIEK